MVREGKGDERITWMHFREVMVLVEACGCVVICEELSGGGGGSAAANTLGNITTGWC